MVLPAHTDTMTEQTITHLVEDRGVGGHLLHGGADLIKVLSRGQLILPVGVQQPEVGVELLAVLTGQLSTDAVQGDVQRPPVSLRGHLEGLCQNW